MFDIRFEVRKLKIIDECRMACRQHKDVFEEANKLYKNANEQLCAQNGQANDACEKSIAATYKARGVRWELYNDACLKMYDMIEAYPMCAELGEDTDVRWSLYNEMCNQLWDTVEESCALLGDGGVQ